jgi:aryl-alcohol dehydrogenase-like predicted oxidoreductase
MGLMVFSALAAGILTGKASSARVLRVLQPLTTRRVQYNDGIPDESRFAKHDMFKARVAELASEQGKDTIRKIRELSALAETGMMQNTFQIS